MRAQRRTATRGNWGFNVNFAEVAEQPRHVIVSARVNPAAELTRWLFEHYRISYHEEPHVPLLRVVATRRESDGVAVVGPEGVWMGAREILEGFDAKSRPGQRLYGESDTERAANRALVERLLGLLPDRVGRYVYAQMLPHKAILYPVIADGVPLWERGFVYCLYPLWRRLAERRLEVTPDLVAAARRQIREACDVVEAELARRGTRFIGGDKPGVVDIVFAALAAPVIFPPRYGAKLPALDVLPGEFKSFIEQIRARGAGQLVLDSYEAVRPQPQAPMPARGSGRPLSSLILEAWPQRIAAKVAAAWGHVVVIFGFAIASRWDDVEDILRRDLEFQIAPINGGRIDEVNGPFVLGLDRGLQMVTERPQLYAAVSAINMAGVHALVAREAERLLDDAIAAQGQIDIVNGYARLVAARAARQIFGLAGPTEMDLMRVIRAVFQHTFLNLTGDEEVRQRALAASGELRQWFMDEIARRHSQGLKIDDVIGRLLTLRGTNPDALDDDGVRRNVAGLLVGAIDTTATAVAKIIRMASADDAVLARVERAIDDPQRMIGWCNELLRLWTHNPVLLRRAAVDVSVGGKNIPAGTTVVAYTQAAMFDRDRFSNPYRLDPTRSPALYRHFGGGLHPCSGRMVNDVQIPELVRQILKRGIQRVERPRYDGPFIDELIVSFGGGRK
jgi:cytochrome P450/glutathione S-transferase